MDREECEARVGTTLRRKWKLERLIGMGGMAAVYEAEHKIGRKAAIKVLHPEIALDKQVRERFEQEALAVNSVGHAGVVEIQDVDETEDGSPFLVMELLEGETLADRVERSPDMPLEVLLRIVDQVLDTLTACHKKGVIHRDIKPENLFLLTDGTVKLLDFGIARVRAGVRTAAGTMLGTVAFMPPEQLKGAPIDSRADIFAVGATMFTVLSGRRVHLAKNDTQLALFMLTRPAPRLLSVASNLHENVGMVVDRALAYLPQRRYPDAQTMRGDVWALQKKQRPPYAFACDAAGLEPNVTELPDEEPPPKPDEEAPSTPPDARLPVTDPQMPAFEPGGGPVPSTDPQLPAFLDANQLAADAEPHASDTPPDSEPGDDTSSGPDDEAPGPEGEEASTDRPATTTKKGWPAVKRDDVEAGAAEDETDGSEGPDAKADDEDAEDDVEEAPLSDPPPSRPPISEPDVEDAREVARRAQGSSSRWVVLLALAVAAVVAAWYTGIIPGFGRGVAGEPSPSPSSTATSP